MPSHTKTSAPWNYKEIDMYANSIKSDICLTAQNEKSYGLRDPISIGALPTVDHPLVFLVKLFLFPCTISAYLVILSNLALGIIPIHHINIATISLLLSSIIFGQISFYRKRSSFPFFIALRSITSRWIIISMLLGLYAYTVDYQSFFHDDIIVNWITSMPVVLLISQYLSWKCVYLTIKSLPKRNIAIVGANQLGLQLNRKISSDLFLQMNILGFFDDRDSSRLPHLIGNQLNGRLGNLTEYVKLNNVHVVYICLPLAGQPRIAALLEELADTTASIYYVPDFYSLDMTQGRIDNVAGFPTMAIRETPFIGLRALAKRSLDLILSMVILFFIWPIMLAIATGVKLTSPGPIIYKQRRYGLDGQEISVYKFRTMYVCENGASVTQAKQNDNRVTAFGRFLRRSSLDELPQFLNVLGGSMSIVGPRPHAIVHNELYRKQIKGYMVRHKVKPGITGWAQINGFRGETSTVDLMKSRVEHDLDYIRNWSLTLDIWIVVRTALLIFGDHRAY